MNEDWVELTREQKDMPPFVPVNNKLKVPPVRIDYYGPASIVYVRGVAIGCGVERVEFKHEAGKPAKLILECNADELQFLVPLENEKSASG